MLEITSVTQLKRRVKSKGVKIFAVVAITDSDEIAVEVKKADFLNVIKKWTDENFKNSRVIIDSNGDIIL
ncbi:MAG: hypothetical protein GY743_23300 [Planctomycetaceae bacterium]|nr:hypothetical protein [Planctomycetaceae bacterium]